MRPADIKSLCTFARTHDEHAFAGLCNAALEGEEWAVARVRHAIELIDEGDALHGADEPSKLRIIRATDTTRPPCPFATASALLAYWDMSWSGKRLQWATWAIWAAQAHTGVSIL